MAVRAGMNAALIDEEYRRRKAYENRKRQSCIKKECEECLYKKICEDNECNDEK